MLKIKPLIDSEARQVTRNITHPDSYIQVQSVTVKEPTVSTRSKSNLTATFLDFKIKDKNNAIQIIKR